MNAEIKSPNTRTILRPGRADDAAEAGRIAYEAFRDIAMRHSFPPDFPSPDVATGLVQHLLSRTDVYSVTAERDGRVIGSNFLWESDAIAGVGPITVDPAVQDGTVGRELMRAVLDRAADRKFVSVRLVQSAYHNRSLALYSKLGFDAREPLSALQGPPLGIRVQDREVRAATPADLDACDALGARILGHSRVNELRGAVGLGQAMVVENAGRITGYTTGVGFFGHSVAESNEDLQALIGAAPEISGPGLLLPTRNASVLRWCLAHGLRVVQPMTLM
ncbi:MAG: GNAT family N-acetyltransferase, partial [Steroidobacteraceae bacterium]